MGAKLSKKIEQYQGLAAEMYKIGGLKSEVQCARELFITGAVQRAHDVQAGAILCARGMCELFCAQAREA